MEYKSSKNECAILRIEHKQQYKLNANRKTTSKDFGSKKNQDHAVPGSNQIRSVSDPWVGVH